MRFSRPLQKMLRQAVDLALPPRCILSGHIVGSQGTISTDAFSQLDFITDPCCRTCGMPFEFESGTDMVCLSCLNDPPPFQSARAALKYNDASRGMVLAFKHGDRMHAASAFTPWMKRAGQDMLGRADILTPVPLHRSRLIARRYNQSMVLAQAIGKSSGIKVIPDLLTRVRATSSQGHMRAADRAKNVARAFSFNPRYGDGLRGKNIILIDDVYTTGATVRECAKVLLKSGVGEVHILTLARVSKTDF